MLYDDALLVVIREVVFSFSTGRMLTPLNLLEEVFFNDELFVSPVKIAVVVLGKRVVYFYLGIAVTELQGCHGISLRRCWLGKHPVCGWLRGLVYGGSGQFSIVAIVEYFKQTHGVGERQ